MRKMRKILGVALVVAMVAVMNLTVFAAPSKQVDGVVTKVTAATDKNGNKVEVSFAEVAPELKAEITKVETVKKVLGDKFVEGMKVVDVKDVKVAEGTVFPVKITFAVPGVNANTKVAVLHFNGTAWETVECVAGKGTITATFTSLSPVAFVVDENTKDVKTSPKTGEMSMVTVAALAAVVAFAGVVSFRKKEFN